MLWKWNQIKFYWLEIIKIWFNFLAPNRNYALFHLLLWKIILNWVCYCELRYVIKIVCHQGNSHIFFDLSNYHNDREAIWIQSMKCNQTLIIFPRNTNTMKSNYDSVWGIEIICNSNCLERLIYKITSSWNSTKKLI